MGRGRAVYIVVAHIIGYRREAIRRPMQTYVLISRYDVNVSIGTRVAISGGYRQAGERDEVLLPIVRRSKRDHEPRPVVADLCEASVAAVRVGSVLAYRAGLCPVVSSAP